MLFVKHPFCARNARERGTDRQDAGRVRKGGRKILRNNVCFVVVCVLQHCAFK